MSEIKWARFKHVYAHGVALQNTVGCIVCPGSQGTPISREPISLSEKQWKGKQKEKS